MFLLLLFLIFISFFIVFIYYSSKCVSQYNISMIVGDIGSGKSTIAAKLMLQDIKKGYHVYCDSATNIPGVRLFDPKNLDVCAPEDDTMNSIYLDEASLVFFSRDFKTFGPYTDFFAKIRHYGCKITLLSQSFDVDLYIRNRCIAIYLIKRFGCISVMRRIVKLKTVREASNESYNVGDSGLVDGYKYDRITSKGSLMITWLPRFWKWHNSFYKAERARLPYDIPVPLPSKEFNIDLPDNDGVSGVADSDTSSSYL